MTKRICWKKGMRLTDEVLKASDDSSAQFVGHALALAAAGRFGLLPSSRPFGISLNITKGFVDVESLDCLAITRGGDLIDIQYDTLYTGAFDSRVQIPDNTGEKEYILVINALPGQWKETNDGYEEPVYAFTLVASHSPITDHGVPIGRIVDEYGWRMDDVDFVPPCLFLSSHPKYMELLNRFSETLKAINVKARNQMHSNGKEAIRVFWPVVQQLLITMDKEHDLMTPMMLLANVQKCVSAFTCACELDENLDLADAEAFRNYVSAPYNYKNAYQRIQEGLEICFSIGEKLDKLQEQPVSQNNVSAPGMPVIAKEHLVITCETNNVELPVSVEDGAVVFYTVNGQSPTQSSKRAIRKRSGCFAEFKGDFQPLGKEPDKKVLIKLMAVVNGMESQVAQYEIILKKSLRFRDLPKI